MSNQPTLPETNPSPSTMDIDPPPANHSTKKSKKSKKRTASSDSDPDSSSSSSDTEKDLINIDFEFFDPLPHDFHGIKLLLRQLFDADSQLLDLSALTDLILDQKLVGSTVKVDGREGDPYSFLSVVNLGLHFDTPAVKSLVTYLHSQSTSTPLHELLTPLFTPKEDGKEQEETRLAIILSERLINMPPDVSPPSYKMLLEEISYAVEDNEPYNFTHYLLLSKVYTEIESSLPQSSSPPPSSKRLKHSSSSKKSKSKSKNNNNKGLIFNFHPEDDVFLNNSIGELTYKYKHEPPEESADSKRAFQDVGILPRGRMVLMTKEGFEKAVEGL
ncbi:Mss4p nuclear export [Orbilia oligospora]|uniref:Protein BCP1 n=1 Tax=Orbilia oligospora TaxID=2813651 RepID=A0A7C8R6F5_ORBOL|nr:Mss4p nuclear export [Orbilia oligospora]